jgi:hypothetical protein
MGRSLNPDLMLLTSFLSDISGRLRMIYDTLNYRALLPGCSRRMSVRPFSGRTAALCGDQAADDHQP